MSYQNRRSVPAPRLIAIGTSLLLSVAMLAPWSAVADTTEINPIHVAFGTAVVPGANTTAFSQDGAIGFAATYGYPDPSNRIYSFDTRSGAILDNAQLSGLGPRQVIYCDRNGYVAVRHDGMDPANPQASIDILLTNTGLKPGNDQSGTQLPGIFKQRIGFWIRDPYAYAGLDDNGHPNGNGQKEIPATDALDDLAFSSDGDLLFYSNGGQMFATNTSTGLISDIPEVDSRVDISAGDVITLFSYAPSLVLNEAGVRVPEVANNGEVGYLSIGVSRNIVVPDDPSTPNVNEFRLYPHARILNLKVWYNHDVKSGEREVGATFLSEVDLANDGITEGSNVVVDSAGRFGIVVGADTGNIYTFRLDSGAIRRVTALDGFAARPNDRSSRGPRRMTVSPTGTIVISRPGNISRPTNSNVFISRPTNVNISRPTNINEAASVVLCQIVERGRVVVVGEVSDFGESSSISNLVFDGPARNAYFATVDGALHALSVADTTVSTVGSVGANAWSVALHAATGRVAVVNGFQVDEAGSLLDAGGVTLGVIETAASKGDSGVGSPAIIVLPEPTQISRPYGTCVAGH